MARQYSSFLLRVWHLSDDEWRVEVEHIQTGSRVRLDSLDRASAWISAQSCHSLASARAQAASAEEEPL